MFKIVAHKRQYVQLITGDEIRSLDFRKGGGGTQPQWPSVQYNIHCPVPDSYKSEFFLRVDLWYN